MKKQECPKCGRMAKAKEMDNPEMVMLFCDYCGQISYVRRENDNKRV